MSMWRVTALDVVASLSSGGVTFFDRLVFVLVGIGFAIAAFTGIPGSGPHPGSKELLPKRESFILAVVLAVVLIAFGLLPE